MRIFIRLAMYKRTLSITINVPEDAGSISADVRVRRTTFVVEAVESDKEDVCSIAAYLSDRRTKCVVGAVESDIKAERLLMLIGTVLSTS